MSKPTLSPTLSMVGNTLNVQSQYEYILALGVIGAFGFGFGTGANDVANAFGTRYVCNLQSFVLSLCLVKLINPISIF